jgi:hypothetical protein
MIAKALKVEFSLFFFFFVLISDKDCVWGGSTSYPLGNWLEGTRCGKPASAPSRLSWTII